MKNKKKHSISVFSLVLINYLDTAHMEQAPTLVAILSLEAVCIAGQRALTLCTKPPLYMYRCADP